MKRRQRAAMVFKKFHTSKEIAHYIIDPDSQPLTLAVKPWYGRAKGMWVGANILTTLVAVGVLVWLSFPQFQQQGTEGSLDNLNWLNGLELACVSFFTVDYILRFAVTDKPKLRFVLDVANIIDVLTTLPFFLQMVLVSVHASTDAIRVMFVFRTIRIVRLGKYFPSLRLVFAAMKASVDLLLLFVLVVVLTVFFTSTAYFFAEHTRYDPVLKMRMRSCPQHPVAHFHAKLNCSASGEQIAPYQSIPAAMYWSVLTMTTVGHGVEAPTTPVGRTVAALTALLGLFCFAAPATILATNYAQLRRKELDALLQRKANLRAVQAMKAQETLRRDLERVFKTAGARGVSELRLTRHLSRVCTFEFDGATRDIYEASETQYVYEPIATLAEDPVNGGVQWGDDFNMTTARRILTCFLVVDSDEARAAAKSALLAAGIITDASDARVLIGADPMCRITVAHNPACAYPGLEVVVEMDHLRTYNAWMQDLVPVRFAISMPHMFPSVDVLRMLQQTQLTVSLGLCIDAYDMLVPLSTDNILASRFMRELYEIAHIRRDGCAVAYVHPADVGTLLEGFSEQFIPTPSRDHVILAPHLVDCQVLNVLLTSLPSVRLDWVPPEAAGSFYKGPHMGIDASDEHLLEVNLSSLAKVDELGFGQRFRIHVPVGELQRHDVLLTLEGPVR